MRALLLAAGYGTRLRPITDTIPKCLVPIGGKPLLQYWLDCLCPVMDQVLINTHYLAPQVEEFCSQSKWVNKLKLVHEKELLGTGGTIQANSDFFDNQTFLVVHADNFSIFNLPSFLQWHLRHPAHVSITMMTFTTDNPESCGVVLTDAEGLVTSFHEKVSQPPGNLANAAVYIFEPMVIDYIKSLNKEKVDISTEVLPAFMGKILTWHNTGYHRDIGTLQSLAKVQEDWDRLRDSSPQFERF